MGSRHTEIVVDCHDPARRRRSGPPRSATTWCANTVSTHLPSIYTKLQW
jgi:hypothetical protein